MRLIILAAGRGTRLGGLTKNTPKTLLTFSDGSTILEKQIANAIHAEFDGIDIVTGFGAEQIEAKIKYWQQYIPINTIYSPVFGSTNSLFSAWLVCQGAGDDFMLTDSDNVYRHGLLGEVLKQAKPNSINIVGSPKSSYDSEDMGIKLASDNALCMSKKIPLNEIDTNCVGLGVVRGKYQRQLFAQKALELIGRGQINDYWEEILNSLIGDGITVGCIQIDDHDWIEVDLREDVIAMERFAGNV